MGNLSKNGWKMNNYQLLVRGSFSESWNKIFTQTRDLNNDRD